MKITNTLPITKFFYGEYDDKSIFYTEKVASRFIGNVLQKNNSYNVELTTLDFNKFTLNDGSDFEFEHIQNNIKNNTILFYRNPYKKFISDISQDLFIFLYEDEISEFKSKQSQIFWNIFDSKIEQDIFLNYTKDFNKQVNKIDNFNYTVIHSNLINDSTEINSYKISDIFKKICACWIEYFLEYFPITHNHASFWCYSVNEILELLRNTNSNVFICDIDTVDNLIISNMFLENTNDYKESSNNLINQLFLNIINDSVKLNNKIQILLRLENFYYNKLRRLQNNINN